jgi:hypothetical protein
MFVVLVKPAQQQCVEEQKITVEVQTEPSQKGQSFLRALERRNRVRPGAVCPLSEHPSYQLVQQNKIFSSLPVWYQNVFWYCPTLVQKSFHRMLAVTQDRRIIANSNTFVSDPIYFAQGYEARYGMMQGLATTFKEITRRIDVSSSELSHRVVLMANTFSGTNSGHDLGIKLSILSAMSKLGILANRARDYDAGTKLMLCTDDLKFPRVMELVELFVPHYAWVVVEEEQLYRVSEMLVVDVNNVNIIAEPNNGLAGIVDEIVVRSAFYLIGRGVRLESLEGRSVILIKQRKHTSIRVEDAFYGNEFMQHAESLGWIIIDPETLDMRYIVHLLSYAQRIVVSYGAIMWTHMAFFNQEATVKYLQCDPNAKPYFPVASHKRLLVHCVSSVELDDQLSILDF